MKPHAVKVPYKVFFLFLILTFLTRCPIFKFVVQHIVHLFISLHCTVYSQNKHVSSKNIFSKKYIREILPPKNSVNRRITKELSICDKLPISLYLATHVVNRLTLDI